MGQLLNKQNAIRHKNIILIVICRQYFFSTNHYSCSTLFYCLAQITMSICLFTNQSDKQISWLHRPTINCNTSYPFFIIFLVSITQCLCNIFDSFPHKFPSPYPRFLFSSDSLFYCYSLLGNLIIVKMMFHTLYILIIFMTFSRQ